MNDENQLGTIENMAASKINVRWPVASQAREVNVHSLLLRTIDPLHQFFAVLHFRSGGVGCCGLNIENIQEQQDNEYRNSYRPVSSDRLHDYLLASAFDRLVEEIRRAATREFPLPKLAANLELKVPWYRQSFRGLHGGMSLARSI